MKKSPCGKAIFETIPLIRKEIACCMIHDYGFKQIKVARLLGLTPAAISQYKCNKRAQTEITNQSILDEIKLSTKLIIKKGNQIVESEICRLCKLINKNTPC
jgi:predicted transcriptional regulator